jgi:hypothetical protein
MDRHWIPPSPGRLPQGTALMKSRLEGSRTSCVSPAKRTVAGRQICKRKRPPPKQRAHPGLSANLVCRRWLLSICRWCRSVWRRFACGPQKEIAGNDDEQNHNGCNDPVLRSHRALHQRPPSPQGRMARWDVKRKPARADRGGLVCSSNVNSFHADAPRESRATSPASEVHASFSWQWWVSRASPTRSLTAMPSIVLAGVSKIR